MTLIPLDRITNQISGLPQEKQIFEGESGGAYRALSSLGEGISNIAMDLYTKQHDINTSREALAAEEELDLKIANKKQELKDQGIDGKTGLVFGSNKTYDRELSDFIDEQFNVLNEKLSEPMSQNKFKGSTNEKLVREKIDSISTGAAITKEAHGKEWATKESENVKNLMYSDLNNMIKNYDTAVENISKQYEISTKIIGLAPATELYNTTRKTYYKAMMENVMTQAETDPSAVNQFNILSGALLKEEDFGKFKKYVHSKVSDMGGDLEMADDIIAELNNGTIDHLNNTTKSHPDAKLMSVGEQQNNLDRMLRIIYDRKKEDAKAARDANSLLKDYIKGAGSSDKNIRQTVDSVNNLLNSPSTSQYFTSKTKADSAYEIAEQEAVGDLIYNPLMKPEALLKRVSTLAKANIQEIAGGDKLAIELATNDQSYIRGKLAESQQRIKKEAIQRIASAKANPDVFFSSGSAEYRNLEAKITSKKTDVNPKDLARLLQLRSNLGKRFGVDLDRSRPVSRDVLDAISTKVDEQIQLGDKSGKFVSQLKEATKNDPYVFLEIIKKTNLTEDQKSAIIATDIGLYSPDENKARLSKALEMANPENMSVVNKTLNYDESKNDNLKRKILSGIEPYMAGLSTIRNTSANEYKQRMVDTIRISAKNKLAVNPDLDMGEAVKRSIDEVLGRVAPVNGNKVKGYINRSSFEKMNPSDIEKWGEDNVNTFKDAMKKGTLKFSLKHYSQFKNLWGDLEKNGKKSNKELNEMFMNEFSDFYFANTDPTGKSEKFVLYGVRNKYNEPVRIYLEGPKGEVFNYVSPKPQDMKRNGTKRVPNSVDELMGNDR